MKKLLITGSNGLLGQKLVYACLKRGNIQLTATARGENRLITQTGYDYFPMDIGNKSEIDAIFERVKPDAVIHAAAMTNVDACETDKEGCVVQNVTAVQYIVDACNKHNAHLIHVSTDFIFDGENGPYDEEAEANPVSYYGWSKAEAERIVKENSKDLAIFGGTAISGSKALVGLGNDLQHTGITRDLLMMGLSVDEINKGATGYIKQQISLGQGRKDIGDKLSTGAEQYIK
jgi:dTDP-4-dehydrorhamnose reductase